VVSFTPQPLCPQYLFDRRAGCAPEPVWKRWLKGNIPAGNRTPVVQPVADAGGGGIKFLTVFVHLLALNCLEVLRDVPQACWWAILISQSALYTEALWCRLKLIKIHLVLVPSEQQSIAYFHTYKYPTQTEGILHLVESSLPIDHCMFYVA
jgi:hypothetical protein